VKPKRVDIACLVFGLLSLAIWLITRQNKELSQYALYLAIIADIFASIPTILFVWEDPTRDRPFAWGVFAIGYGLAIFAITEHTFANYALPIYMFLGASSVTSILAFHRLKQKIPIREWV
jgi:hypothetical protein